MKTQHTPGPYHYVEVVRDGLIGYEVRAEDESVICEIRPRPFLVHVREENARLIAAAPELLGALKAMREEFVKLYQEFDPSGEIAVWDQWTVDADNAITKAEGK